MDTLARHEIFEIDVLERLKNSRLLDPLVFGGGTMLRLCHELNRYSVDLDLWFIKPVRQPAYFNRVKEALAAGYEVTDAQIKFYTLLFEIRSPNYPQRLKIEIRRGVKACDYEERIAFSRYGTKQVLLRVHSLEQTMKNKIAALLDREEIRDCFDIEFLLRKGTALPKLKEGERARVKEIVVGFKERDFKVKLGSILDRDTREFYIKNKFEFLLGRLVV